MRSLPRLLRRLLRMQIPAGITGRGRGPEGGRTDGEGGAGVREPRRPKPTLPAAAAEAEPPARVPR